MAADGIQTRARLGCLAAIRVTPFVCVAERGRAEYYKCADPVPQTVGQKEQLAQGIPQRENVGELPAPTLQTKEAYPRENID